MSLYVLLIALYNLVDSIVDVYRDIDAFFPVRGIFAGRQNKTAIRT